jgi:hypothetical protein
VQYEGLNSEGERIAADEMLELSMRPGEIRERNVFQFVDEQTTDELKTATFRIATASKSNCK